LTYLFGIVFQYIRSETMHLKKISLLSDQYPTRDHYPFNLPLFHETEEIPFHEPVTFFVGENGTGKSTLLEAIAHRCGIHIWRDAEKKRAHVNPFEKTFYRYISVEWADGHVPGAFFSSELFQYFTQFLDEWAAADPEMLKYFGGRSLMTQSHGQSLMSYFKVRYKLKGLYLLDEPETALSPKSQIELLRVLNEVGRAGHAQFIIASHSPILLACPDADIYSFDDKPLKKIGYEETEYYRIYKAFMEDRSKYIMPE
jgi:predicted ATPase